MPQQHRGCPSPVEGERCDAARREQGTQLIREPPLLGRAQVQIIQGHLRPAAGQNTREVLLLGRSLGWGKHYPLLLPYPAVLTDVVYYAHDVFVAYRCSKQLDGRTRWSSGLAWCTGTCRTSSAGGSLHRLSGTSNLPLICVH